MPGGHSQIRSTLPGLYWPGLPDAAGQQCLALLYQLERSQWWSPAKLREYQFRQLQVLLPHALGHVPYYRDHYTSGIVEPELQLTEALWQELPVLRRSEVQENTDQLFSSYLPPGHGAVHWNQSTGSTGRPIRFAKTDLTEKLMDAFQARDFDWQGFVPRQKIAVITPRSEHAKSEGWGAGFEEIYVTGESVCLNSRNDIATQARWLAAELPVYLICTVTNLTELARYCLGENIRLPGLRQVRAISEVMRPELKELVHEAWGARLSQSYSCEEAGLLAIEHPDFDDLYVQDENVYLEVLDGQGRPCAPGEIGEVVITHLSNFAMPLIRYALGDYANLGESCPHGRGLTVLQQVMGRQRNYLRMADGRRLWPNVPSGVWFSFPAIRRFQIVQHSLDEIEVRLEVNQELTAAESEQLQNKLRERLQGADFEFRISYHNHIERGPGGKFEDVISLVEEARGI